MKKTLLSFIFLASSLITVAAQSFGIGVKGGVNFANTRLIENNTSANAGLLIGFHGGIIVEYGVNESFYINASGLFSQKGFSSGEFGEYSINYTDIHLNFVYKRTFGQVKLFGELGPYVGLGLSGKSKIEGAEKSITFGSEDGQYNNIDAGLFLGLGVEFRGFFLEGGYQVGLSQTFRQMPFKTANNTPVLALGYIYTLTRSTSSFDPTE